MPLNSQIDKIITDFNKRLNEPGIFTNFLGQVEAKTNIKRLHLLAGLLALHALYLLFGRWAELLCNITGFIYPAYFSIAAIESASKDDDTQWLTYWVIFGLLNIGEFFSQTIVYYFPFYWLLKCIFLIYLYLPMTSGAQRLYIQFIRPFHAKHHGSIDSALSGAQDRARKAFEEHVKPN